MSIIATLTDGNTRCEYGKFFQTTAKWKVAADYEDIKFFREVVTRRVNALRDEGRITLKQLNLLVGLHLDRLDRAFLNATQHPEGYGRPVWDSMRETETILDWLENTAPRLGIGSEE